MPIRKEEINRKILHVFSGTLIPALILYLPLSNAHPRWLPQWLTAKFYAPALAAAFTALFVAVEMLRFRVPWVQRLFYGISRAAMRPDEKMKMTGATYMVAAAFLCSIVFVDSPSISFMVLCAFIWGDAAAALLGQSIGTVKIGNKSLEGSLGCFAMCMALFIAVFPHVPHLLDSWKGAVPLFMSIAASLSITVMELFPIKIGNNFIINDNLTVPLITGFLMEALYPMLR